MNLFKKNAGKTKTPGFYTPVYCDELTNVLDGPGQFVEHARYKAIYEDQLNGRLTGIAYTREGSVYFVVDNPNVLAHIKREGMVPVLFHTPHIRWFENKGLLRKFQNKQKRVGA